MNSSTIHKQLAIQGAVLLALAHGAVGQEAANPSGERELVIQGTRASDSLNLDAVAPTSSRLGVPIREIPASVFTLEQPAFQARGNRTALEAIESVVGFTGANSPGNGATLSTRGFVGDDVQQLWDGIRIINPAMGARPIDTFNLDSIEIIKGPASVLHGEGAVGGAINLIPKEPNRDAFKADLLASYGTWNTTRFGMGAGGPVSNTGLSYRADISRNASDSFQKGGGFELYNFSGAVRYDVNDALAFTVYAEALRDDMNAYFGVPLVDGRLDERLARMNYNVSDNVMKSETYWLRMKTEWKPADSIEVKNLTYGAIANRDWRNAEGYSFDPATGRITLRDLGIVEHEQNLIGNRMEMRHTGEIAGRENRFVVGGDIKRTDFFRLADFPSGTVTVDAFDPVAPTYAQAAGAQGPSQKGADYEMFQVGPFVEDQFALLPNLKFVGGLRFDYMDNNVFNRDNDLEYGHSFHPVTYRGGVVWDVVTNTTAYAQYSVAAGAPRSLVNIGGAAFSGFNFSLEETRQVELGLKHTCWNGRIEATAAVFHIEKDRIRTFRSGGERVGEAAGETKSDGIELEAVFRPVEGWTLGANFTALSVEIDRPGFAEDGARPSNVPLQTAALFSRYVFPFGLELGAEVRHVGNRLGNDPSGTRFNMEDYVLVGAHAAYSWRQFTLTVRGRNLTDERYLAWSEDDYGNQALVGAPVSVEVELSARF